MDLRYSTSSKIKNKVICDRHFKMPSFMNWKKERLIKTAYPTILIAKDREIDLEENPQDYLKENEQVEIPLNFMVFADILEKGGPASVTVVDSRTPTPPSIDLKSETDDPSTLVLEKSKNPVLQNTNTSKPKEAVKKPNSVPSKAILPLLKTKSLQKPPEILNHSTDSPEKKFVVRHVGNLNQVKKFILEKQGNDPSNKLVVRKHALRPSESNPAKVLKLDPQKNSEEITVPMDDIEIIPYIHVEDEEKTEKTVISSQIIIPTSSPQKLRQDPSNSSSNEQTLNKETTDLLMQAVAESWKQIDELKSLLKEKINSSSNSPPQEDKPKIEPLQMKKVQLFNGIKKYLNPSMAALLRIELFGAQEREWKTDEKVLSIELLKLGRNVYDYLRDELRFRLPPSQVVEKWIEEDHYLDDVSDAC